MNNNCRATIVIPSYNEKDLELTLDSLKLCASAEMIFEVIVVFNCAESEQTIDAFHKETMVALEGSFIGRSECKVHFINASFLPEKHAGVGMARKIGMDEAVRRFGEINYDGLIVCLDADCTVSESYLTELEKYAVQPESYNSICLNFEHRYDHEKNEQLKEGIIFYELFLRYYKEALKWAGFPFHFHTIGSSMAVKTSSYCKSGGMNRRKAGEDFYFLQKVFPYGKVIELNSVKVYPSARISDRVPFGTGRAQQNFIEKYAGAYPTYNFKIFEDLKQFLSLDIYSGQSLNEAPHSIKDFLLQNNFPKKFEEIKNNTGDKSQFYKRFFNWFDGFLVLKYVHFARDNYYPNTDIKQASAQLLKKLEHDTHIVDPVFLLEEFRKIQLSLFKNAV